MAEDYERTSGKASCKQPLYPDLATAPPVYQDEWVLILYKKLQEVSKAGDAGRGTLKKYKKAINAVRWLKYVLTGLTTGVSTGALATMLTGVGAPVGAVLAALGGSLGLASIFCEGGVVKLEHKINKHRTLVDLANSYTFQLHDDINKAIADRRIDEGEFQHILKTFEKYESEKTAIWNKFTWKNTSVKEMEKKIREDVMSKLR